MVQVELWQLVLLLVTFLGACGGVGKLLLAQTQRHIEGRIGTLSDRLGSIEETNLREAAQWQRVERELMKLQADLPLHYVRREDYIRGQSVIEAKLDGLALRIENVQLRGAKHAAD
ncbi:MAG: hypothetical protein IAE86_06975 [Burkholderiaceae bacterium]|nr:hypothetical protein [Burkholderiaceae bacterium]